MSTAEAAEIFAESGHHGMPVVSNGKLAGLMTLSDLAAVGGPSDDTIVADVMTVKLITVFPGMPVSAALARMAALDVGRLPVVADDDPLQFVGMFRRESVVRAYHHALGGSTARSFYRERHRIRTQPGASFFEVPIRRFSAVHGRPVREVRWPAEATLVSVRRGQRVIVPHGNTMLEAGDTITAFGSGDARIKLAQLLEPVPDEDEDLIR